MVDKGSELPKNDFMGAFKVANFEVSEDHNPATRPADDKRFWQTLLADSVEKEKAAELERLGKGMRERRRVCTSSPPPLALLTATFSSWVLGASFAGFLGVCSSRWEIARHLHWRLILKDSPDL